MRKRKHNRLAGALVQHMVKGMARQRRQGRADSEEYGYILVQ